MSKIVGVTVGTPLSLSRIEREIKPVIENHEKDKENPHGVTAEQVGLGNVNNTSDMDKPVSTAQANAIADAKKAGTDAKAAADNAQTAADNAQSATDTHIADQNNPHGVTTAQIGAQAQHQNKVITLSASNWPNKQQTVSVAGLKKEDTVFSTPDASSREMYAECNVKLSAQGNGTLTYVCEEAPASNLTINVSYFPVGGTGVAGGGSSSGGTSSGGAGENTSGGGGNFVQVQSDWNQTDSSAADFIKNKPFGESEGYILPEQELPYDPDQQACMAVIDGEINAGDTLTVVYDGTKYVCTALYAPAMDAVVFGNVSMLGGDGDTGEPFFAAVFSPTVMFLPLDTDSHVIGIISKITKKIPAEYMEVRTFYVNFTNTSDPYIYTDAMCTTKATKNEVIATAKVQNFRLAYAFDGTPIVAMPVICAPIYDQDNFRVYAFSATEQKIIIYRTAEYVPEG